jgi:hypothetical protein
MREAGLVPRAERAERIADKERELAEKERLNADTEWRRATGVAEPRKRV